jgi:D-serine deaminase-like pyridoxal phosphate-dependent protein
VDEFYDVNEVRPGNFVFYDLMQYHIGSCEADNIALAVLCPIISKSPERSEIVVQCGAVHLSKESLEWKGHNIHGRVVELEGTSISALLPDTYVKDLSQEHGVIKAPREWVESKHVGDPIAIIPVHSCLAVAALGAEYVMNTD